MRVRRISSMVIEALLSDVLLDGLGDEIFNRASVQDFVSNVGRGNFERGCFDVNDVMTEVDGEIFMNGVEIKDGALTSGGDEKTFGDELESVVPSVKFESGVGAEDEVELRIARENIFESVNGIDGVGGTVALELDGRDVKIGVGACGEDGHGEAVKFVGELAPALMRRASGGNKEDLSEIERFVDGVGGSEMPVVDRIESAAHYSDFHQLIASKIIFLPDDEGARSTLPPTTDGARLRAACPPRAGGASLFISAQPASAAP